MLFKDLTPWHRVYCNTVYKTIMCRNCSLKSLHPTIPHPPSHISFTHYWCFRWNGNISLGGHISADQATVSLRFIESTKMKGKLLQSIDVMKVEDEWRDKSTREMFSASQSLSSKNFELILVLLSFNLTAHGFNHN